MTIENCPHRLSAAHAAFFEKQGYLAFENALTQTEVEATRQALTAVTRSLMQAAHAGEAGITERPGSTENYRGYQVTKAGSNFSIHFESGFDPLALAIDEADLKYRKLCDYHHEHEVFEALVVHERVKGFLEQLIGQEVILKNSMALAKPPFIGSEKPWHQDNLHSCIRIADVRE